MSAERNTARVLRPKPWLVGLLTGAALVLIIGAVFTYRQAGWTFVSFGLASMSVLACGGVLEVATSRIVLSENSLESGSMWSRRRYAAADIVSVTWESGGGVSVKLSNGGWAKLPDIGYNSQGLANTLRAWLKRSRSAAE